jgi:cyclic pyranopterin phosphate synthase
VIRALPVLADPFARTVTYLRVSLTDRCNYRCTYCMPEEGVDLLPKADILTFEELERVVRVFAKLGVRRVRLTGGEPTVRKDLIVCVERLARVPGIAEVVMTTNGQRLAELAAPLAAVGLAGLNVSLDTLDAGRFREITRRGDLGRVVAGIEAARALRLPVKINVVALKGWNDREIGALCDWSWDRDITPRFIEHMPMSDGALFVPGHLLTAEEIRALVEDHVGAALVPDAPSAGASGVTGPARYWRAPRGRIGIISAMSENFCSTCNRVRLTAVGELHTCLAHDDATNLRALVRSGAGDDDIEMAIRGAVGVKRQGHEFQRSGCGGPRKHMVSIGG